MGYSLRTSAPITNFKNVNKLKIKAKSKNRQVSSLNKRRKFNIKNPLEGNGFLDRLQNMSPQKKMALNLKIKEKMLAPLNMKHKDAANPSIKSNLHFKTKSDIPIGEYYPESEWERLNNHNSSPH